MLACIAYFSGRLAVRYAVRRGKCPLYRANKSTNIGGVFYPRLDFHAAGRIDGANAGCSDCFRNVFVFQASSKN